MKNLTIWKFEHAAILLEYDKSRIAIDFGSLSAGSVPAIGQVDASLVSHQHADHFDIKNLELLSCESTVFAPSDVAELIIEQELTVQTFKLGQCFNAAGVFVTPVVANHGPKLSKPIENYGFVLEILGKRIYFVGDAAVPDVTPSGSFDLVAIPVGGVGFTFDPIGALNYLNLLEDVKLVVPVHYHGISDPTSPDTFRSLAKDLFDIRVLDVGEGVTI